MKSKLTLSLPSSSVLRGKRVAKARGLSLSELVEQFINGLDDEKSAKEPFSGVALDSRVASLYGAYRLPKGKDLDQLRLDSLVRKHLA